MKWLVEAISGYSVQYEVVGSRLSQAILCNMKWLVQAISGYSVQYEVVGAGYLRLFCVI